MLGPPPRCPDESATSPIASTTDPLVRNDLFDGYKVTKVFRRCASSSTSPRSRCGPSAVVWSCSLGADDAARPCRAAVLREAEQGADPHSHRTWQASARGFGRSTVEPEADRRGGRSCVRGGRPHQIRPLGLSSTPRTGSRVRLFGAKAAPPPRAWGTIERIPDMSPRGLKSRPRQLARR